MAEVTRRAMYDLVWSKPMTKVAADFNISDVALKKICDKHRVPTPPRGYWAKKEAGQKVKQTQFHATADGRDELITIYDPSGNLPPEVKVVHVQERARRKIKSAGTTAPTPPLTPVEIVHPAVLATANTLRKATGNDGAAKANGPGQCGVSVGFESVERTIWILDGLARRVEARGLAFTAGESCIVIKNDTDSLQILLMERVETRKHAPNAEELAVEKRLRAKQDRDIRLGRWTYSNERAYPEFDLIRTGELALGIKNAYVDGSLQRNWRDGKRRALQGQLDDIAGGIVTYLAGIKARRERHERWEEEWQQQEARRERNRARAARHKRRMDFVISLKALQDEAADLQAVLAMLEKHPRGQTDAVSRMEAWMMRRIDDLAHHLKRDNINVALKDERLFPKVDQLGEEE